MTSLEELDRRLTVVERKVAMEAELRASQDRDLSRLELKVDKVLDGLQTLATTSSEHNRRITRVETRLDRLEVTVNQHTIVLGRVEGGIAAITGMLTQLIERDPPAS